MMRLRMAKKRHTSQPVCRAQLEVGKSEGSTSLAVSQCRTHPLYNPTIACSLAATLRALLARFPRLAAGEAAWRDYDAPIRLQTLAVRGHGLLVPQHPVHDSALMGRQRLQLGLFQSLCHLLG